MAEVSFKKTTEHKTNDEKGVAKRNEGTLTRPGLWNPDFSWNSSEFLSSPFSLMRRFSEEMDRTLSRFFSREDTGESFWSPAVEVTETSGQLQVHADLPGLKPEDVRVEVANDKLIIQGERKYEQEEKKKGFYRSERHYGQFYRAIPLPEGASTDQAKARFNNGVLEISLPVPEQKTNRREIPIELK